MLAYLYFSNYMCAYLRLKEENLLSLFFNNIIIALNVYNILEHYKTLVNKALDV